MCLRRILKNKKRELPKEFTAYKAVIKEKGGGFTPPMYRNIKIQKENKLDIMCEFAYPDEGGQYKPYFHSFRSVAACKAVEKAEPKAYVFIKIKIKKRDVTCVGVVGCKKGPFYQTIISRSYTTEFEEVKFKK